MEDELYWIFGGWSGKPEIEYAVYTDYETVPFLWYVSTKWKVKTYTIQFDALQAYDDCMSHGVCWDPWCMYVNEGILSFHLLLRLSTKVSSICQCQES